MLKSYKKKRESTWVLATLKQNLCSCKLGLAISRITISIFGTRNNYRHTKAEEDVAKIHQL